MKNGTFIITELNGRVVAAIKRADSQIIELEIPVTPDLQKLDGKPCKYLLGGDKIVLIGNTNILKQQRQEIDDKSKFIEKLNKPSWSNNDSFDLEKARVPADTKNLSINNQQIDNFSLKLNRFARYENVVEDGKNKYKFIFFKKGAFQIQAKSKNFGNLFTYPSQLADRQIQSAKALLKNVITPVFSPEWRFVTGLGGHSVYETGITLHHVYGVPYIPASSIKGILRSWIIFSKFENSEKLALKNEIFCWVFGCPKESVLKKAYMGRIVFFDALPREAPIIEPDIMNPHYPKWYRGASGTAPVDTDSPKPVIFLTVKDTPFQFVLGSKAKPGEEEWNIANKPFWDGKNLEWWLENALSEHGLGAKTAVGYGYFKKE